MYYKLRNNTNLGMYHVVVSHERIEGGELHPAGAQLLCGVTGKATCVGPNQGDREQLETQHRWDEKI